MSTVHKLEAHNLQQGGKRISSKWLQEICTKETIWPPITRSKLSNFLTKIIRNIDQSGKNHRSSCVESIDVYKNHCKWNMQTSIDMFNSIKGLLARIINTSNFQTQLFSIKMKKDLKFKRLFERYSGKRYLLSSIQTPK